MRSRGPLIDFKGLRAICVLRVLEECNRTASVLVWRANFV